MFFVPQEKFEWKEEKLHSGPKKEMQHGVRVATC